MYGGGDARPPPQDSESNFYQPLSRSHRQALLHRVTDSIAQRREYARYRNRQSALDMMLYEETLCLSAGDMKHTYISAIRPNGRHLAASF